MKAQNDDLLVYDEDEAVKYILEHIAKDELNSIDEVKIEYVLDVVYEYYEENGLIEEDSTEEASIDEEQMFQFILKCAEEDDIALTQEELQLILDAEFEYGKSIGIYQDEE
jgi:hypothetical protein